MVIEEFLDGPEVSLFAVTDGVTGVPLLPAQDFKRAGDGDQGPNTGGMGAYAPLPWAPPDLADDDGRGHPAGRGRVRRRGTPYRGLLYAGLALTSDGLRVVEFNARFGDPETQVVLDRLAVPAGAAAGRGGGRGPGRRRALEWRPGAAVVVVIAAEATRRTRSRVTRSQGPNGPGKTTPTCCTRAPRGTPRAPWYRRAAGC